MAGGGTLHPYFRRIARVDRALGRCARSSTESSMSIRCRLPCRLLASDLPPWSTIYRWFAKFRDEDRFAKINHALVMFDRERTGRESSPTAAIIDSQSVKTTELADHAATMPARRSTDASAMHSSIRMGVASSSEGGGPWRRSSPRAFARHLPIHPTRFR